MERSRQGFTIIELVVVILVLGILAAVALPKFVDLRNQAHTAAVRGTGGALAAAMNIVHAGWLAEGGGGATVTLEDGTVVAVNANGWPTATTEAECATLWGDVLQSGAPSVADSASYVDEEYEATFAAGPPAQCTFDYQTDGGGTRSIVYDATAGAVATTVP